MKNILFPTDFSKNANNALNFALELARMTSAKLTIFNAFELPYNRADMMVSVMDILKEDSEAGLKETMEDIRKRPQYANVNCETLSRIGDVVNLTADLVKEKDIDLVVMGTKGASGILEEFIGSNTSSVIKNINCPILTIPENARFSHPKSIGYAYDLKPVENPRDLRFLADLARLFGAEMQIYSVVSEANQEMVEKTEVNLKLNDFFSGLKTEVFFAINGDIIDGIQELVKNNNPDWIVMVAKKYRLFESLFHTSMTRSMVFQTDKPMLVLHNYLS